MKAEEIKEWLEARIADYEKELAELKEETERDLTSFQEAGVSEDGEVHNHGNSNDCYESGYDNGISDGEWGAYIKVLRKVQQLIDNCGK
jgi:hypothetical protein